MTRSSSPRFTPGAALLACACGLLASAAAPAGAADTRWWTISRSADYADAESRGVVIDADGVVGLGPAAVSTPIDSLDVVWSAAVLADGRVALGGDRGRIVTWSRGRVTAPWVTLPVGQVLSLIADGDDLIAGTGPEGFVYRVRANGDTTRMARTGERYVWALVAAEGGGWYAATGTEGRIVRIERDGRTRTVLDTDEANIVALISDGRGGVIGGGDTHGRVVRVDARGAAHTLYDAEEEEIRALARTADGAIYAAALSAKAVQNSDGGDEEAQPRPARRPASRETAKVYRIVPDSVATEWWTAPRPAVFAMEAMPAGVVVATGHRAGLFVVDGPGRAAQWLAASQAQITALARSASGTLYAATTGPAALWEVREGAAREGELLSPVLDAKRIARFGRPVWSGELRGGRAVVETRSGNAAEPDTTWSGWDQAPARPARYLQWRLRLTGGEPRVTSVEVPYRENNLPPRIGGLRIAPPAEGFREGRLSTRTEPVTQELEGGRKVEFSLKRRSDESAIAGLPLWVQGLRSVHWSAEDPNEDPLRYRLEVRHDDDEEWLPVAEDLADSVFVWDTHGVPDGAYRLRVTATDVEGNAVGEEREVSAVSGVVRVDNTPPALTAFSATGGTSRITVRGRASDSPGLRFEVAVGDGPWRAVTPDDGLAGGETVSFAAALEGLAPGVHAVSVRVIDRAGNFTVRATRATVTR